MHTAAQQYVGIVNGELVCHTGVIQFPMRKGWKRVHRLVVLPDYQGIGIGKRFIAEIAKMYAEKGYTFNLATTTPSLIHTLCKDLKWTLIRYGREKSGMTGYERYEGARLKHLSSSTSVHRVTYSFCYNNAKGV